MSVTNAKRQIFQEKISVIIPAATPKGRLGYPYGFRLGSGLPTPNLAGNISLLGDQMGKVRAYYPNAEFVVVGPPTIKKKDVPDGVRVVINDRAEDTGVARSIGLGLMASIHPMALVIYGNTFFPLSLLGVYLPNPLYTVVPTQPQTGTDVGVASEDGHIKFFFHGLQSRWVEILFLQGKALSAFIDLALRPENSSLLTSEVLNAIIKTGVPFVEQAIPPEIVVRSINSQKDLKEIGLAAN